MGMNELAEIGPVFVARDTRSDELVVLEQLDGGDDEHSFGMTGGEIEQA
jgi:hypothetical protein